jgi:signal transduction histidine kinase/CHASE1-domain containing sensor protein
VLLLGVSATLAARWFARQRSLDFYQDQLVDTAQNVSSNLEVQVRVAGAVVESLAAFFENTTDQTQAEFRSFVARAAKESPGLFGAAWQAEVKGRDRAKFEATMRAAGHTDFQIVDLDANRASVPAATRESHLPVTYVYAPYGDGPPMGFDLGAYPGFMAPKWLALESGAPAATALMEFPSDLPGGAAGNQGFIISAAVVAQGDGPLRARLKGFTSASFLVAPMMRTAAAGRNLAGLRISLFDAAAGRPGYELAADAAPEPETADLEPYTNRIQVAGRTWTIRIAPTAAFLRGAMVHLPDLVLAGGLLLTLIVAGFVANRLAERQGRKLIEHERRAAERKFHEVVANMAGAVTVFGAAGEGTRFTVWDMNAASLALAQVEGNEIIGRSLAEVFGPELHAHVHEAMRRVRASGCAEKLPPFPYERGGRVRWLLCNVFRLGSGEIVVVGNDLTSQKEVEQELRQARAELEIALDASRVGLWSWDSAMRSTRIDARAAAILDVGNTEVLREPDLQERVHAEDRERLRADAQAAIAQAREFESEIRFATRDGTWRRLCVRARPTLGVDGAVRQIVGCVWDATQRRNQEDDLQQRQRLEAVATLAGGIAHDLNNALAPLTMGLDLLRMRFGGDAESAETLQSMSVSARRAATIVKQLSGLARGGTEVVIAAQPSRVLDTLREQLRDAFPPGITVKVLPPAADLPAVQIGARQLHQVVQNLCVNAREAMRSSGTLTVEARAMHLGPAQQAEYSELTQGAFVAFVVQDTGPGIPDAIRGRIFDPFFTTKEACRGSGLGLSTALAILRSCRGTIRVDSREGQGARFTVMVPVAPEAMRAATTPRPAGAAAPSVTLRGKTVLLADDEPMVREVARRVLEKAGMRVLVAQDGREAIDFFTREAAAIDIVVLDLIMPNVDGPTAGAAIRGIRADIPLLGASGHAPEGALEQARTAGFTSFLPKPYTMDGLLDALRAALARPVPV